MGEEQRTVMLGFRSPVDGRLMRDWVRRLGHKVVESLDETGGLDLVLLDAASARRLGDKVFRLKKEAKYFLPVLVGIRRSEDVGPWLDAGFDDAVHLPATKAEWRARMEIMLRLRRQSEELSQKSEYLHRALIESSSDHIFLLDANGAYVTSNDRTAHLGLDRGDKVVGKTIEQVFPKEVAAVYREQFQRVLTEGKTVVFEHDLPSDQATYHHLDTLYPVNLPDGTVMVGGFCRDITERKQAEEALKEAQSNLQALLDNRKDYIWALDRDYNYIVFNQPYADVTYSHLGVRLEKGMNALEIHPKEVVDTWKPKFDEVFKGKYVTFEFSHVLDGKEHFFEVSMNPIYTEGGITGLSALSMDITERKQAEEALRLSRERLNHLFSVNPAMVYELDPENFSTTWVSPNVTEVTGYTPEEARQPGIWAEHVHPEDREATKQAQERLKVEGRLAHEYRFEKKDGTYFWVRDEIRLLRDEQGRPKEIVGSWMNITDRKEAEIELAKSEQRYRRVFENSGTAMIIVNEDGAIALANGQCAATTGYSPEELQGTDWRGYVFADDLPMMENYFRLRFRDPDKAPNRYETRLIHADGSTRNCLLTADAIPSTRQIVVSMLDITDRVQAEKELRVLETAIDNAVECIMVSDRENRLTYVNRAFEQLTGYSADEVRGQSPSMLESGPPGGGVFAHLEETIQSGKPWQGTIKLRKKSGSVYEAHLSVTPVLNEAGLPEHFVSVHRDVTAERQREARSQQSQRLESLGTLAGGVAHDFNNLLMGIGGYVELCQEGLPDEHPNQEWLNEIARDTQRLANLARQLLAFARKQVIAPRVLDLNETVEGMLKLLRRLIGEDIEMNWKPGPKLWPVKLDPGQVDQLLANLCVNARDAIDGVGNVVVETANVTVDETYCAAHADAVPGEYVRLAVSDDGCGMDRTTLEHLFEPFFTTKSTGEGTGLGLATVHGIVRQNNGFVNVYSEPGKGTTFKIYLPRATAEAKAKGKSRDRKALPQGDETILLVEDEKSVRVTVRMFLHALGYTVLAAETPEEAQRLAAEHAGRIHLLITDVVMPGMNGRELALSLAKQYPEIRILFMSGYTANVIAHRGVLEEEVAFLTKPFTREAIAHKVREVLDAPTGPEM